jgi:hypothetical protein
MITAYHRIAGDNFDLPVDLTLDFSQGVEGIREMDHDERIRYYNTHPKGIKWYVGEEEYIICEEGQTIHGMITPDFTKVVVVYPYNHPVFNSPSNAVIYNEDGSIHTRLPLPMPVAEKSKWSDSGAFEGLYIGGVIWVRDEDGQIGMAVNLVYDREYGERRVLDYKTGEIGRSIGSFRI